MLQRVEMGFHSFSYVRFPLALAFEITDLLFCGSGADYGDGDDA
jgi:hypothetical protein